MSGILFAALAIAVRLTAYYTGHAMGFRGVILLHLFFILLAIFFEGRKQVKETAYDFVSLFKAGMRGGVIYSILAALFCYFYFSQIAPEVFELRNAAILEGMQGEDAAEQREAVRTLFTPGKFAQGSFFGYFMISVVYSLLMALVQRKVLSKF